MIVACRGLLVSTDSPKEVPGPRVHNVIESCKREREWEMHVNLESLTIFNDVLI